MALHGERGPNDRGQYIDFGQEHYEQAEALAPYLQPIEAYSTDGILWIHRNGKVAPYVPLTFAVYPQLHLSTPNPEVFDSTNQREVYVGAGSFWATYSYSDGDLLQELTAVGDITKANLAVLPWSDSLTQYVQRKHHKENRYLRPRRLLGATAALVATIIIPTTYNYFLQPAPPQAGALPSHTPPTKTIPTPQPTSWVTVMSESPSATPSTAPTVPPKSTSKSMELSVASWNAYKGIKRDIGQTIVNEFADQALIGLQETKPNFGYLQKIACHTCEYSLYPTAKDIEKNPDIKRNAVIWKKDTLKLLGAVSIQTSSNSIKGKKGALYQDVSDRFYSILLFQEKASKEKFYFINTHLPAYVSGKNGQFRKNPTAKSARAITAYRNHMDLLGRDVAKLELATPDTPILIGGDFNIDSRQNQKDQAMPNNVLGDLGFEDMYRMTNYREIDANIGTHSGSKRLIDNIYVWPGNSHIKTASARVLNNGDSSGWNKSDHRPVVFTGTFIPKES